MVPRDPLVRMVYADSLNRLVIPGLQRQIVVTDSLFKNAQEAFNVQLRQVARLEEINAGKDRIISLYEANEKDLRKQLKRARAATTLTGLTGIAVAVLAVILLK